MALSLELLTVVASFVLGRQVATQAVWNGGAVEVWDPTRSGFLFLRSCRTLNGYSARLLWVYAARLLTRVAGTVTTLGVRRTQLVDVLRGQDLGVTLRGRRVSRADAWWHQGFMMEPRLLSLLFHEEVLTWWYIRAYIRPTMEITKCHEDVQQGGGTDSRNGAVLHYVAAYDMKPFVALATAGAPAVHLLVSIAGTIVSLLKILDWMKQLISDILVAKRRKGMGGGVSGGTRTQLAGTYLAEQTHYQPPKYTLISVSSALGPDGCPKHLPSSATAGGAPGATPRLRQGGPAPVTVIPALADMEPLLQETWLRSTN
eukprot:s234_g23.t1